MPHAQVLVVDDDADVREFVGNVLSQEGVQVSFACDGRQALARLEQTPFEVLFTDLGMPGVDGLALLRGALRVCPQLAAVVFTGYAKLDSCIEALRLGACDYVTKPFTPLMIRAALGRALAACQRKGQTIALGPLALRIPALTLAGCVDGAGDPIVAQSAAMRAVCALAAKIAPTDAAVLIRGEPGVGKELVARAIHRQSRRAAGPFVCVTLGAIPETELEAWLFGREQGDCAGDRPVQGGLLEAANGGTIFLADVDCLPLWAQVQLFAVLQRGCVLRRPSLPPMPLDVRVIASTCCDLEAAVAEGRFHGGLYYVFSAVSIHVPPLRERPQDIKILAERCLAQTLLRQGIGAEQGQYHLTPAAWQCLLNHTWPGNLFELSSVVAHAVALTDGPLIGKEAIALVPASALGRGSETISVPLAGGLRQIERYILDEVIQRCRGNKAAAARVLGLHRRTLYRMLEEDAGDAGHGEPP